MKIKTSKKIGLIVFLSILVFLALFTFWPKGAGAQLADSPWPVLGHDARHTNVSPYKIGKGKKELLWSYKAGSSIESSPAIGADGTIYVGCHDGFFHAVSPDGSGKWKVKLTDPIFDARWNVSKAIMASPAIASDGTVYINAASGYLHAFNPDSSEKWRFPIKWSNDFWNGPNIGPDGTIYIGTARHEGRGSDAGLVAITPDGKEKWRSPEPSGVTIVPTVSGDGTIISGAADSSTNKGKIISLNPDGTKKWEFWLKEWLEGSASIGSDGTIFSGSKEGDFYALNPDGSEKWRFKTGGGISAMPTISNDGNVYIGSWDGNFYAFDQSTGKEKWRFDAKVGRDQKLFEGYPGKETIITGAPLSKDGVLVFADVFDTVYAVDTSGKELWRWKAENGGGFASSPAISKDGVIYIGNEGGNLYALDDSKNIISQANGTSDQSNQDNKAKLSSPIIIIFSIVFLLAVVGLAIIFYRYLKNKNITFGKKMNMKIMGIVLTLTTLLIIAIVLWIVINLYKQRLRINESGPMLSEQSDSKQNDENSNDEFIKNAARIPGPIEVWIREFGEVARSCAGKGCGSTKDTCVRWNKTKDNCYETVKTMPASSDRYKIYCNMVIVNQDKNKAAGVSLNLNYTAANGEKHLVQKISENIEPQNGKSLGWTYEVDTDNIGKCGYDDIAIKEIK